MKKINKLVLPLATVALGSSIVMPLVTACGSKTTDGEEEVVVPTVELTDVNHGYIPEMEKHEASTSMSKSDAEKEYFTAVRENPEIAAEDYRNFIGSLPEYIEYVQRDDRETYPGQDFLKSNKSGFEWEGGSFSFSSNSLKAGMSDFELKSNGLVSYTTGIETSFAWDTYKEWDAEEDMPQHNVHFDVDLNVTTAFKNFNLDVKHGSTDYVEDLVIVTPTFPGNLAQTDWSLTLALTGSLKISYDGLQVLNAQNINFKKKFDYRDEVILNQWNLTRNDTIRNILENLKITLGSDIYLTNVLQALGTFTSYYMEDVVVNKNFQVVGTPHFTPVEMSEYWDRNWSYDTIEAYQFYKGTIVFQLDEEYNSLNELNSTYKFEPHNYNVGVKSGSQYQKLISRYFPAIINPDDRSMYMNEPFKDEENIYNNAKTFKFKAYTDETGKTVKDKVCVDIWFNPSYNTISTRDIDNPIFDDIGGKLSPAIVVDPSVEEEVQEWEKGQESKRITELSENDLGYLDFSILTIHGGDETILSKENHADAFILDKPCTYYENTDAASHEYTKFYIPSEIKEFYDAWSRTSSSTQDWNWKPAYGKDFGRYEDCTFDLQIKLTNEIPANSTFMVGNWAIYDLIYNADLGLTKTLPTPDSVTGSVLVDPCIQIWPILQQYGVLTIDEVTAKQKAWKESGWEEKVKAGTISEDVDEYNKELWGSYYAFMYPWAQMVLEHSEFTPTTEQIETTGFSRLQRWHQYFNLDNIKGKFSIESMTITDSSKKTTAFTDYSISDYVLTFDKAIEAGSGTLDIVVKYEGPKNTNNYYKMAYQAVSDWSEYMQYLYWLQWQPTSLTEEIYWPEFRIPSEVYFYTFPFITFPDEE